MKRPGISYHPATQHLSNLGKAEVDTYAAKAAALLKLEPGGEIEPLVVQLGGRLHYQDLLELAESVETIFVHAPSDFDIILSSISSKRRDRFTIAHEVGHYLLHSRQGLHPLVAARSGSNRAEWEANWFAAGFLMPSASFKRAHADGRRTPLQLANMFGVSQAAAEVRMKTLSLAIE